MKKILAFFLSACMLASLAACSGGSAGAGKASTGGSEAANSAAGGTSSQDSWKFTRNIEIVCPWGAGGGADTTLRTFGNVLSNEIGVKVVVNNKEGAGGAVGVQYALQQPADGYTWLLCTQSPLLATLTGAANIDFDKLTPVCRLVHDTNIIVTGKNSPYNNFKELKDYIAKNPGTVKCGCMSITGLDGLCVKQAFGDSVEAVAYSEGAQMDSDVMAGHISLAVVGPAEISSVVASKDVKPILACSENRMKMDGFQNCECAGELGVNCYYGPYRGIFAKSGTPDAAIKAFSAAAKTAVASKTFQDWAKTQGLDQRTGWQDTADFKATWEKDTEGLKSLISTMKTTK